MGHYNSFVIRIWSNGPGRMRGTIEHVASRNSQSFANPEAVLEFIQAHLSPPADDPCGPPPSVESPSEGRPRHEPPSH
jgi:hypothetical protein